MKRTALIAGLIAFVALPATAGSTQLARSVGVEPGDYSLVQLITLQNLKEEPGGRMQIQQILDNPQGSALVGRLSTTDRHVADN